MITDKLIDNWKKWLEYYISRNPSTISNLIIQLRDSEKVKTFPGIYLEDQSAERIDTGGIADGNAYRVSIKTMLVSVPADSGQNGTTKAEHDSMRDDLAKSVGDCLAQDWINSQIGIVVFESLTGAPVTTAEDGYRVTSWTTEMVACLNA
jgi:hypothetical protein